jgi:ATP-dependent Clp protease ATP-binding subunit ClpX
MVEVDTTNILFIAGGAFVELSKVIKNRVRGTAMGFQSEIKNDQDSGFDLVTPDDLMKFGMIPEFVGRFPSWVALNELSLQDLILILTEIKNSYIAQYEWLFEQDQVRLEFSIEALEKIARNTLENKTGARGLHSELERVLLPHMFNLTRYREQGIDQVIITEELVNTPTELKDSDGKVTRKLSAGH